MAVAGTSHFMNNVMSNAHAAESAAEVAVLPQPLSHDDIQRCVPDLVRHGNSPDYRWHSALSAGLKHTPYTIVAQQGEKIVGFLPLCFVRSHLFGRFLVSLPYVNVGGVVAITDSVAAKLIEAAAELGQRLNVDYVELRHEQSFEHSALPHAVTTKVHMRMPLPGTPDELWTTIGSKVRNQVRKGERSPFEISWGRSDALPEFYSVFSRNMRDLGTPVYGRQLFTAILREFGDDAEFCILRLEGTTVAAAMLIHSRGMTEVPSASSLREFNATNANMLMYWHLLKRAVERGSTYFDFGRSTQDSNTYRFKQQWGAVPHPSIWQYFSPSPTFNLVRPDNPKFKRRIEMWKRLPLSLTRLAGPYIMRRIP